MDEEKWYYEKLDENGKVKHAPVNDADGKITGRHVFGLQYWFDENPEERKRLGWVKHLTKKTSEIQFNRQTQYLLRAVRTIDEYTVEDVYYVRDKTEEMMRYTELNGDLWELNDFVLEAN